ncbi:MAG: hypothetical protein J0I77_17625 [Rudaea sp.]|uniref:hypothetical protein n=1 Tax=unclassified Rudaea TaxID=2627037 RepID=UPI0010FA53B3|nr:MULTISPECIES: hypothetical protein [unclassified Rudaea]MBN8887548.1 hypothetical protein [Rudaea sp.]
MYLSQTRVHRPANFDVAREQDCIAIRTNDRDVYVSLSFDEAEELRAKLRSALTSSQAEAAP